MVTMRHERGYIALMAVLIVGAAALAIGVTLLATGTDSQRTVLVQQQYKQARTLAITCAEEALQQIHDNTSFTGSNNISLGQGTCTYTVSNAGGSSRTVDATGTVSAVSRKVQISATVGTTISITSWKDVTTSGPLHVQSDGVSNDTGLNNIARAFPSNLTAGSTVVASVTWDSSTSGTSLTCTDTQGNTFTTVNVWTDVANTQSVGVCYARSTSGGADTVTATFGGAASFRRIVVSEYGGLASSSPVDVSTATAGGTSTTATDAVTSGTASTTQNGDLIYGAVSDTTTTTTIAAGTGFTQRFSLNAKDFAVQDKVQTTAGSVASTQTFGTASHRYVAVMVAFKAAP